MIMSLQCVILYHKQSAMSLNTDLKLNKSVIIVLEVKYTNNNIMLVYNNIAISGLWSYMVINVRTWIDYALKWWCYNNYAGDCLKSRSGQVKSFLAKKKTINPTMWPCNCNFLYCNFLYIASTINFIIMIDNLSTLILLIVNLINECNIMH